MSLVIDGLTKQFGASTAVDNLAFTVPDGAFCAVVGASGCGKSTLLRLIAGLETPDAGRIRLGRRDVFGPEINLAPEERAVGVVFQSYALWPHLSVRDNVAFPYEMQGAARADARSRADAHLETVALTDFATRKPEALSGGQRQRVALARCLAGEAQTVLMDEPLANLDPHLRAGMEEELRAFHDRSGATTLYITHDQREAMALADVMAVMSRGRFLQMGAPAEIYDRPAVAEVAQFIGRGALIEGHLEGELVTTGPLSARMDKDSSQKNGPVTAFLRPRDIAIDPGGAPGRIDAVLYRGGVWEARVAVPGLGAALEVDLDRPARVGEAVPVRLTGGWVIPG